MRGGDRGRAALDRVALRRLRLLAPSRGRLIPVNRGDMPMAWWAKAGICARHAPSPISEPGPRAFWRATQNADFCGEGLGRERTT